jgi:hypothetical protein
LITCRRCLTGKDRRKAASRTPRAVCISCGSGHRRGRTRPFTVPLLCLVLQGAKEVATSRKTLRVADRHSLVVSHALPVVSSVTEATQDRPYVALVFPIDLELLRGLAADVAPAPASPASNLQDPFSISLCPTDPDLEEALLRYLRQCETDETRRLLAPITAREIHARLLLGPHAGPLHKLLWHETTASRIFRATREIQSNLASPLPVGELADRAGMSSSAFFEHFRAVTGTSPLQYQKDLRLLARPGGVAKHECQGLRNRVHGRIRELGPVFAGIRPQVRRAAPAGSTEPRGRVAVRHL